MAAAAAPKAGRRTATALASTLRRRPANHVLVLVGGALLIALAAALVAVKVTVLALDETVMQQSALHYASGLPHSLLHDVDARATNRLYSLVLSVVYRITGGPDAIRIDRVLSVLMFVSAVFPIYVLARRLLASRAAAVAVALLSVLAPWLALTTALFTENLSYPLFWWALLACCDAIERPSRARDLRALLVIALLVGTRVQFAAVAIGYVLCVLVACALRARGPARGVRAARARGHALATARLALRSFPATLAIAVVVIAGVLYARASGEWHAHVARLLGSYTNVVIRNGLPPNMAEGVFVEVIALALGVGLLPVLVALPWYARAVCRPRQERRWLALSVCGAILVVFLVLTVYAQGGYLGPVTEERYFFYVIPVFWIGAFAAVAERSVRAGELIACTVVLACLYAAIPLLSALTSETVFLEPVEAVVPHVLRQRLDELGLGGTTVQGALFGLVLAAGALTALLWRSRPAAAARWVIGAAVIVQLLIAGYAYAVMLGRVHGIPGRTGSYSAFGWIDAAAGSHEVTWLDNENVDVPPAMVAPEAGLAANQAHVALFYNSQLRSTATVPAAGLPPVEFPLTGMPVQASLRVDPATGMLGPAAAAAGLSEVVGETGSPFLQLSGQVIAHSPDGVLSLTRVAQPPHASWLAEALLPDGGVIAGPPVHLEAFAPAAPSNGVLATLDVQPLPLLGAHQPPTELLLRLGSEQRVVPLPAGSAPQQVTLSGCAPASGGAIRGSVAALRTQAVRGRALAGQLVGVSLRYQPCAAARG